MKRLLFTVLFLLVPMVALAQDEPGGGLDLGLMEIVGVMITGVAVPLAVRLLTYFWPKAPSWLKAIAAPVLVPAVTYGFGLVSAWLGMPIDISGIMAILLGGGSAATVAYTLGKQKAAA